MERDKAKCPIDCAIRGEVVQALNEMKTGKVPGRSVVPLELIATNL